MEELQAYIGLDAVATPPLSGQLLGVGGLEYLFGVRIEVFWKTEGFSESTGFLQQTHRRPQVAARCLFVHDDVGEVDGNVVALAVRMMD
ncbi:hypothetical protein, partial [Streptomyces sp. DH12]|uniref:hypothetical protein n=1 Tax=Streptomyces sp. DH12 TaxID=2857010 RepID=UPI001E4E7950